MNLNSNRQPAASKAGIASIKFTHDARGNTVGAVSRGEDGRPVAAATGDAEVRRTYDENGNVTEVAFFDGHGNLVTQRSMGAAVRTFGYDARGNITESAFRDTNRRLVRAPLGFAKLKIPMG